MESTPRTGPELAKTTSVFLDLFRIAAALVVFASHCFYYWHGPIEPFFAVATHRAVIVFFVLSGYVIAYSTLRKKRGLRDYVVARLSRLYSVVLPAVLLTLFLYCLGRMIDPEVYRGLARSHDAVRYLCCALFLQSIWNTNSVPFSNGPFWSLGYEFWYYAIFGAVVLIDSAKWRILLVLAMALFVGPAILLLMPCWLVGVVLYLGARKGLVPASWAWIGFLGSVPVFAVIFYGLPVFPGKPGWLPLLYANAFASDFVVALGLAGMIWCFDQAFFTIMLPARLVGTVRFWADHTFSLYLYHVPLIIFAGAVVPFDRSNPWQDAAMAGGVLATVLVLSLYTESKRPQWARFFDWTWDKTAAFFRARGS